MFGLLLSIASCTFQVAGAQERVTTISVAMPGSIVHATVPLPDGFAWDDKTTPLSVHNPDGSVAPTQWERVVWSPKGEVRVAEIIARVKPGSSYSVVAAPQSDAAPSMTEFASAMLAAPPVITIDDKALITKYRPEDARNGSVEITREFSGEHVFGWVTARVGDEFVLVDFVLHDATPGSAPWFFASAQLVPPEGASVVYGMPEPQAQGAHIVPPRADGKLNFIEQRGRREFRIAIAAKGHDQEARSALIGQGFGVASTWTSVPAYQPQQLALPDLAHLGPQLAQQARGAWSQISKAVANGTSFGIGTIPGLAPGERNAQGTRVGFRHAFGAKYGGITGGGMVDQWRGMELAQSGEPQSLLALQLEHRMLSDRHAVGLYTADGDAIRPEDFVDAQGKPLGNWSLSPVDGRFDSGKDGAFKLASERELGVAAEKVPDDYAELLSYAPIDYQHGIRRWSSSITLAWLSNDMIARREITLNARLWCAGMWSQGRLDQELAHDEATPGHGTDWGRAHGWGWHLTAAAYAIANTKERAQFATYLDKAVRVYLASQMVNGIWQANANNKEADKPPFNSKYATEQTIELGITAHALMAILGSYDLAPKTRAAVQDSIVRAGRDGVWKYLWDGGPDGGGTWQFVAVRERAYKSEPFAKLPDGLNSGGHDSFQIGSTLAYARMFAHGDGELAKAVRAYTQGAASPLAWLKSKGFENLGNRTPLIFVEQHFPSERAGASDR
jgi:hypothetical protein